MKTTVTILAIIICLGCNSREKRIQAKYKEDINFVSSMLVDAEYIDGKAYMKDGKIEMELYHAISTKDSIKPVINKASFSNTWDNIDKERVALMLCDNVDKDSCVLARIVRNNTSFSLSVKKCK